MSRESYIKLSSMFFQYTIIIVIISSIATLIYFAKNGKEFDHFMVVVKFA